jgi:hypothetical protein
MFDWDRLACDALSLIVAFLASAPSKSHFASCLRIDSNSCRRFVLVFG